jgi:hypothetical protein
VQAEHVLGAQEVGIKTFYVRSGTLTFDGTELKVGLPQVWSAAKGAEVWLVLNADKGALKHFEQADSDEMAREILGHFRSQKVLAEGAGATVVGLQLDFDVPTRLLPLYAKLFQVIRKNSPALPLSCTGLQDWVRSRDFSQLASSMDWVAPQLYEGYLDAEPFELRSIAGGRLRTNVWLSDLSRAESIVSRLREVGVPFAIGVPTYNQSFLFLPSGRFAGVNRSITLEEAFRNPRLRFAEYRQDGHQQVVSFLAIPGKHRAEGDGYTITFMSTGIESVKAFQKALGPSVTPIYFSWPTKAPEVFLAGFRRSALGNLKTSVRADSNPSGLVEGTGRLRHNLRIRVEQQPGSNRMLKPDGLILRLRWNGIQPTMPTSPSNYAFTRDGARVLPANANELTITRSGLLAGDSWEIELEFEGAGTIRIEAKTEGLDGKIQRHSLDSLELS